MIPQNFRSQNGRGLTLNPRVSPQRFTPEQRERLFLTGLLAAEAEAYAAWLGDGYRLPTVTEWRAIYRCFQSIKLNCHSGKDAGIQSQGCEALGSSGSSAVTHSLPSLDAGFRLPCRNDGVLSQNENSWPTPCAAALLRRLEAQVRPQTLLDFSLLRGGVVEWVRDGNTWTGLGAPRPSFKPNLWNPLSDTVPPIRPNQRLAFFGARWVRNMVKIP